MEVGEHFFQDGRERTGDDGLVAELIDEHRLLVLAFHIVGCHVERVHESVACLLTVCEHAGQHLLSTAALCFHHGIGCFFRIAHEDHLEIINHHPVAVIGRICLLAYAEGEFAVGDYAIDCLLIASGSECYAGSHWGIGEADVAGGIVC